MGRGDRRSRKGKTYIGSYGNVRPHKVPSAHKAPAVAAAPKVASKPAAKKKA
jgi:30S ribosomal protein S31